MRRNPGEAQRLTTTGVRGQSPPLNTRLWARPRRTSRAQSSEKHVFVCFLLVFPSLSWFLYGSWGGFRGHPEYHTDS
jgi:hypothetical protein